MGKPNHLYITTGNEFKVEELVFEDRVHWCVTGAKDVNPYEWGICGVEFASFVFNFMPTIEQYHYALSRLRLQELESFKTCYPISAWRCSQGMVWAKMGDTVYNLWMLRDDFESLWQMIDEILLDDPFEPK